MSDLFHANLAALTRMSPAVAERLSPETAPSAGFTTTIAASGVPIVEWQGRALDTRRDPVMAAARAVADVHCRRGVLLGWGTGYVADALLARGVELGGIVIGHAGELAAAMAVRDFRHIVERVPVVLLDDLADRVALARARGRSADVVVHEPSAAIVPELRALADRWAGLRSPRRPRVLVVGPIYGGSLDIARHVAAAAETAGTECRLFDASTFDAAYRAFGSVEVDARTQDVLRDRFALLIGDAVAEAASAFRPDLVLALAQAPLSEPALQQLRHAGIPTAFWFVENWRVIPYWSGIARHYDMFYAIQPGAFLDRLRAAGAPRAEYLPLACDPAVHRPVALDPDEHARYGAAVSFAGAPYLNRRHSLAALVDFDLKLWGDGWTATPLARHAAGGGQRFTLEDRLRIFAATAVNVNLHSAEHTAGLDPAPDYVNPRTFELAACGAFQLVDRRDPLPDLFTAGEMIAFESIGELRTLVAHYLERPEDREAIAARARARALADHTYTARVRRVLRDMLEPELVAGAEPCSGPRSLEDAVRAVEGETLSREEAMLRIVLDVRDTVGAS